VLLETGENDLSLFIYVKGDRGVIGN
jgi:hypothetical protein